MARWQQPTSSLYWMEAPHPFTRSWHHALCASACGCRWFVQLIRLVWYIQVLWFHQGQRVALRLPVLFWLFYLVTPLFPGFGSGMYGVISLVSCTFVPCTHGLFWPGLAPFSRGPCLVCSFPPCTHSTLHTSLATICPSQTIGKSNFLFSRPSMATCYLPRF